ncbi:MAG: PIN domain-containing protein [Acidobacteria bacterium]|nr:PIN domain-containing protein [Acidobacteriota bacterium]
MGENQLLVDTDILIAYINRRAYRTYLQNPQNRIYYSAITKKELLSKQGLRASERRAILALLRRFRLVRIDQRVSNEYSRLRTVYPSLGKGDALVAASALLRNLPLLTQNRRHFRVVKELVLLPVLPE